MEVRWWKTLWQKMPWHYVFITNFTGRNHRTYDKVKTTQPLLACLAHYLAKHTIAQSFATNTFYPEGNEPIFPFFMFPRRVPKAKALHLYWSGRLGLLFTTASIFSITSGVSFGNIWSAFMFSITCHCKAKFKVHQKRFSSHVGLFTTAAL